MLSCVFSGVELCSAVDQAVDVRDADSHQQSNGHSLCLKKRHVINTQEFHLYMRKRVLRPKADR